MNSSLKILVCGDVEGKIKQLFSRVTAVNAKSGPFEMLLCVGDFFHESNNQDWENCLKGLLKAPLPIYILGPTRPELIKYFPKSDGAELCTDIVYLGKGFFTGSSGLQIAYMSGVETRHPSRDRASFTVDDIKELIFSLESHKKLKGIDILLTSQWPKGLSKYASQPEKDASLLTDSLLISQLVLNLKPRYHFAGLEGIFYERQPYRNHRVLAEGAKPVTRFLGLAKVGNPEKKKFLYAFNITPLKHMTSEDLIKQPLDVTENPFHMESIVLEKPEEKAQQFFYDMSSQSKEKRKRHHQDDSEHRQRDKRPFKADGPCWFCLGSPEVDKQLVVSVGNSTYLALAKGGLVDDHCLILPIAHHQSTCELSPEILDEINKYKIALKKFFKHRNKTPVFYERNYKTQHLQIQVIPISLSKSPILKETFVDYASSQNIELNEIPRHTDLKQVLGQGTPYFYVELESGEKLLHKIKKMFPLNFGREVLASPPLLNMEERADWRVCEITKEHQAKLAATFRENFEQFDFNLL